MGGKERVQSVERREICGFSVMILRKKQKNMYLSVSLHATPRVSCPLSTSDRAIDGFVTSHARWLAMHLQGQSGGRFPVDDGATLPLWGKTMTLSVLPEGPWGVTVAGRTLLLRAPRHGTEKERRALMEVFLRSQLREALIPLLAQWQSALNVHPSGWRIKDMTGRWGSCSVRTHRLCFNLKLTGKDRRCLEYVVVHELCHLIVPNHSEAFWNGMASCLPDWRARRKLLRGDLFPESPSDENSDGQSHPEQCGDHAQQR